MPVTVKTFPTLSQAASAMTADGAARFMGGGTLVMRALNEGDTAISTVVRSTDESLAQARSSGARVELGGGVTMAAILANRELSHLHAAARAIGGPAVRSMATVGGNLCAPSPYGDFAAALLALDATVTLQADQGRREIPLEDFLRNRERGTQALIAVVSHIRPASGSFRFLKVSRVKPKGIAVLTIAALLPVPAGRVTGARIAYGALGPTSMRARAVERALEGRTLDDGGVAPAVAAATEGIAPASDAIASDWYRRETLPVHLRRLLLGTAR
jgi:CO/xanthine dehydrogenase FAD-binding subunit